MHAIDFAPRSSKVPCERCNGRGTISTENVIGDPEWEECPVCRNERRPSEVPCTTCKGSGFGHVDMMRLGGGPIDENGNMRWMCSACGGRGSRLNDVPIKEPRPAGPMLYDAAEAEPCPFKRGDLVLVPPRDEVRRVNAISVRVHVEDGSAFSHYKPSELRPAGERRVDKASSKLSGLALHEASCPNCVHSWCHIAQVIIADHMKAWPAPKQGVPRTDYPRAAAERLLVATGQVCGHALLWSNEEGTRSLGRKVPFDQFGELQRAHNHYQDELLAHDLPVPGSEALAAPCSAKADGK